MTANQDQIQRLLTEVQTVLAQGSPRLPWGSTAQIVRQRQVLEQVRLYLQNALFQLSQDTPSSREQQAQDMMRSMIEAVNALRSTLLHPLHSEVSNLMQQRTALLREIRQLEAHRDLLRSSSTVSQSQERLPIEKLQVVHDRADHVLTRLDSTLHVVFESLQKEIQAYQDSLSQGIDKMHTLGQQSEVMFSSLMERLATQIERDGSALLQNSSRQNHLPQLAMPYAGAELPTSFRHESTISTIDSIAVLTELLDQVTVEVDESPIAVPTVPPQIGSSSGREAPAELISLFQGDLPKAESMIEPNDYSMLDQETSFDSLKLAAPAPFSSPGEPVIFTLEGIENLFDDVEDQHNG
ncbi:MAG: hypothetical protein C4288_00210 [Leptolyngbya sp. ERB_1_1]